jgi:tetratricopeptide (TPR) repeat protein
MLHASAPLRRIRALLGGILLPVGIFLPALFLASPARAQASCATTLEQAEAAYVAGEHESAIGLLSGCVSSARLPPEEVMPAFRLLALAHLETGEDEEAKMALLRVLGDDPSYEPDPMQDPRTYSLFVDEVKRELLLPSAAAFRCDREMVTAQAHYDAGAHEEAIGALTACLEKPELDPAEAARAHRLMALTHLRMGALADAREAVLAILEQAPEYEADPVRDLPAYASLVTIVRRQLADDLVP